MTDCDLIADFDFMTDFNGIYRYKTGTEYPAGIEDKDKSIYKNGAPSSEYPNLTLAQDICSSSGNCLKTGFYTAVLSYGRGFIDLYQSGELKARVKVLKYTEKMLSQSDLNKEAEIKKKIEKFKSKNRYKKQQQAEEELAALKETEAADTYAVLEDSQEGYYILKYNCFGHKAEGIIQK